MEPKAPSHPALRGLAAHLAKHRANTARLLALLAEFDRRKLYLSAGYTSTYLYCVHEFKMDEDEARERVEVARTAREFPALFPALEEGQLELFSVMQLAPHLTADNVDELIAAATHKTEAQLDRLLAERFA